MMKRFRKKENEANGLLHVADGKVYVFMKPKGAYKHYEKNHQYFSGCNDGVYVRDGGICSNRRRCC